MRGAYRTRAPGVSPYADARLARGLTQAEVAELVGCTPATIKRLERGCDISRTTHLAVRFALGMSWLPVKTALELVGEPARGEAKPLRGPTVGRGGGATPAQTSAPLVPLVLRFVPINA